MSNLIKAIWDRVLEYGIVVLITIAFIVIYLLDCFNRDDSED